MFSVNKSTDCLVTAMSLNLPPPANEETPYKVSETSPGLLLVVTDHQ
jgi:hypothetical protein